MGTKCSESHGGGDRKRWRGDREGRWMLEWQVKWSNKDFSVPVMESQGGGADQREGEGT